MLNGRVPVAVVVKIRLIRCGDAAWSVACVGVGRPRRMPRWVVSRTWNMPSRLDLGPWAWPDRHRLHPCFGTWWRCRRPRVYTWDYVMFAEKLRNSPVNGYVCMCVSVCGCVRTCVMVCVRVCMVFIIMK